MNILTKNRIIEKGDEFRHTDGRWLPVPAKKVGLQILFSDYKEVRRPSEEPQALRETPETARLTEAPKRAVSPTPISPDSGLGACTENPAKAEKEKTPVPTPSGTGDTPATNSHLPTVISRKAHKPAWDGTTLQPPSSTGARITPVIEYSDLSATPKWIGRNGTFNAIGLNVSRAGLTKNKVIQLRPVGKRGLAKNALIEIPVADAAKLAARLMTLVTK
jgi:hypothetical protein